MRSDPHSVFDGVLEWTPSMWNRTTSPRPVASGSATTAVELGENNPAFLEVNVPAPPCMSPSSAHNTTGAADEELPDNRVKAHSTGALQANRTD